MNDPDGDPRAQELALGLRNLARRAGRWKGKGDLILFYARQLY